MKDVGFIKRIMELEDTSLKELLWRLCYDKEATLQFLQAEKELKAEKVIELIQEECKNNSRDINFAGEKPVLDTLGVDLGIKNPIVRDVIVMRCYRAVFEEHHHIKKAINLIKTEDDGTTYTSRRMFGGLLEIGFSNNEVSYIKDTCNLYPISLLLERLDEKLLAEIEKEAAEFILDEKVKVENVAEEIITETITDATPNEETKTSQKVSLNSLLTMNDDIIQEFLGYCCERYIDTEEEFSKYIEDLKSRLEYVENLKKKIDEHAGEGINISFILQKKDTLEKMIQIKKELQS